MKGLIKVFSIIFSFIFALLFILFIFGLSFRVYNINDFKDMLFILSNDLNINLSGFDFIYSSSYLIYNILIFVLIFVIISLINIKDKFYISLKYFGSVFMLGSSFMLISLLFSDKIVNYFDGSFISILDLNYNDFIGSIYRNGIIYLIVGFVMIILFSLIDSFYENYKNKKIISRNV